MTQVELEQKLHDGLFSPSGKNIVMMQCTGSRNADKPYCSRVCCSMAVKNALRIKRESPDSRIFILYRDIRTYGFREKYYRDARKAGIVFMRYDETNPPQVTDENGLVLNFKSSDMRDPVRIEADSLILSTGISAPAENRVISDMLKLQLNADGFFLEAHIKLRPVDFATEGIYLCGLAHSPKMLDEKHIPGKTPPHHVLRLYSPRPTGGRCTGFTGQPGQVYIMHDLCTCMPLRRTFRQRGRQGRDSPGQVHGLRDLRFRMSRESDTAESFRIEAVQDNDRKPDVQLPDCSQKIERGP
jgi:hypothetical protein